MSSRTFDRVIRVRAVDDTTAVLLGIRRAFSATRMEARQLGMEFQWLADQELISAETAEMLGAAIQSIIPVVGIIGAALGIVTAMQITARRAAIPVGQTAPGQFRQITSTGPMYAHAGEVVGRPSAPTPGLGGGAFTVQVQQLTLARDGEEPESVGRTFARIRAGTLSSDVPAS